MFAVCLAISIFTQFSPQYLWTYSSTEPTHVAVEFEKLNGIKLGAAVVIDGQLIGSVDTIETLPAEDAKTGLDSQEKAFQISLKVAPHHRALLRQGTIALIKSPISASHLRPQAMVELLLPQDRNSPALKQNETIVGYSSFQEFWSADLSSRGVNEKDFRVS